MKINISTDESGRIISWTDYPFNDKKPYLEVEDPRSIRLGFDKVIKGELVKDEEGYISALEKEVKKREIELLKASLSSTDYMLFKYLEGELPKEEYLSVKKKRQGWRNKINLLEEEIK